MGWLKRLFARKPGEFLCASCNARFSSGEIDQHAQQVARISTAEAARMFGTSDIAGSVQVFKYGEAYCPRCVTDVDSLRQMGRTVRHEPLSG